MKCDPNLYRAAPPSLAVKPRLIRQLFLPPLIIALMIGLGYIGFWISEYYGIRTLSDTGERQLELHARTVESELSKYTYLPSLLELESSVSTLLAEPNQDTRKTVNDYLEGLNRRSRSRAIYVMDTTGRVLATSNWRDADSYQGEDLSFRAYFPERRARPARAFLWHRQHQWRTRLLPGPRPGRARQDHRRRRGQGPPRSPEERWKRASRSVCQRRERHHHPFQRPGLPPQGRAPLSDETKDRLAHSLQYYWATLNELEPLARERLNEGTEKLTFPANSEVVADEHEVSYLAQTRPLSDTPWNFTLLTPLNDLRRAAINQGILVAVAFGLVALLLIAWNERRKVIATRLAAREALQEANSQLERRIAERTADLRASNERLKGQIRERRQSRGNPAPRPG